MTAPQTEPQPDTLGGAGRAQVIAHTLMQLQRQRFELEVAQTANGAEDHDSAPGLDGKTYAGRRAELEASERRLCERYAPLMTMVEAITGAEGP